MNKYGWLPDHPDIRDKVTRFAAPVHAHFTLPPHVDLRDKMPAVYDQGALGSCTANAIAAAIEYERARQGSSDDFTPSRLFVYYNERVMEGTVASDAGAMIRNGIKSVARLGDCPEEQWPYDPDVFAEQPPQDVYDAALHYRTVDYWRVPRDINQMRGCLAAGFPFVFGFSVYESFESDAVAETGIVDLPKPSEQMLGGHAVLAVGYDDAQQRVTVRNSWGATWGDKGYFYLPYAFLLNDDLSEDFWTIKLESA